MAKEQVHYYDYDGKLTQKQAKWWHRLDKCPKYFVTKSNPVISGRLAVVGQVRIQQITDLMDYAPYRRAGQSYSDYYHKPGFSFMTTGGQGYERVYKEGKVCLQSEFKVPAWRPIAFGYDRYMHETVILQSWEEIFEYVGDRDFEGSFSVYKNPEQ